MPIQSSVLEPKMQIQPCDSITIHWRRIWPICFCDFFNEFQHQNKSTFAVNYSLEQIIMSLFKICGYSKYELVFLFSTQIITPAFYWAQEVQTY